MNCLKKSLISKPWKPSTISSNKKSIFWRKASKRNNWNCNPMRNKQTHMTPQTTHHTVIIWRCSINSKQTLTTTRTPTLVDQQQPPTRLNSAKSILVRNRYFNTSSKWRNPPWIFNSTHILKASTISSILCIRCRETHPSQVWLTPSRTWPRPTRMIPLTLILRTKSTALPISSHTRTTTASRCLFRLLWTWISPWWIWYQMRILIPTERLITLSKPWWAQLKTPVSTR